MKKYIILISVLIFAGIVIAGCDETCKSLGNSGGSCFVGECEGSCNPFDGKCSGGCDCIQTGFWPWDGECGGSSGCPDNLIEVDGCDINEACCCLPACKEGYELVESIDPECTVCDSSDPLLCNIDDLTLPSLWWDNPFMYGNKNPDQFYPFGNIYVGGEWRYFPEMSHARCAVEHGGMAWCYENATRPAVWYFLEKRLTKKWAGPTGDGYYCDKVCGDPGPCDVNTYSAPLCIKNIACSRNGECVNNPSDCNDVCSGIVKEIYTEECGIKYGSVLNTCCLCGSTPTTTSITTTSTTIKQTTTTRFKVTTTLENTTTTLANATGCCALPDSCLPDYTCNGECECVPEDNTIIIIIIIFVAAVSGFFVLK